MAFLIISSTCGESSIMNTWSIRLSPSDFVATFELVPFGLPIFFLRCVIDSPETSHQQLATVYIGGDGAAFVNGYEFRRFAVATAILKIPFDRIIFFGISC